MSKKAKSPDVPEHNLSVQIEKLTAEAKHWRDKFVKSEMESGVHMAASMENNRLVQREKLVALIAANKPLEAIDFLLTTQVMMFKIDVRFADDETRIKAEDEQLEKVKALVAESVKNVKFNRANHQQA